MKVKDLIKKFYKGKAANFALDVGESRQTATNWADNGYYTHNNNVVKNVKKLPKEVVDHIKKMGG